MTKNNTRDLLDDALATEAKILELTERAAAMKARRAGLSINPGKDIEKEIAAKLKAEAEIDAELIPLEMALEHLNGGIDGRWAQAQNALVATARKETEEMELIVSRARDTCLRVLKPYFPDEDLRKFRAPFDPVRGDTLPHLEQPLWGMINRMHGVKQALELLAEVEWRGQGRTGPTGTDISYDLKPQTRALAEFLEAYPARKAKVEASITRLSTFVDHIEATFITADEAGSQPAASGRVKVG